MRVREGCSKLLLPDSSRFLLLLLFMSRLAAHSASIQYRSTHRKRHTFLVFVLFYLVLLHLLRLWRCKPHSLSDCSAWVRKNARRLHMDACMLHRWRSHVSKERMTARGNAKCTTSAARCSDLQRPERINILTRCTSSVRVFSDHLRQLLLWPRPHDCNWAAVMEPIRDHALYMHRGCRAATTTTTIAVIVAVPISVVKCKPGSQCAVFLLLLVFRVSTSCDLIEQAATTTLH